jgi:hypothetical protein
LLLVSVEQAKKKNFFALYRGGHMKKILLLLLSSASLFADDIYLGNPGYGGTGCPQGTVSATLSPDQKQLSILFDQYVVEAGREVAKRIDRKSCNIAIPVHIPQGYSVSILSIDYRGFNSLTNGARSQFSVEYFFADAPGPKFTRNFSGPVTDDFLINNQLAVGAIIWSRCGADVNLRTNSSMLVQANARGDQALASIDSQDISAGLIYHLQWRRCN